MHRSRFRCVLMIAFCLSVLHCLTVTAAAASGVLRIVQDDAVLVHGDDAATRARALDELRAGGADIVRAILRPRDVAGGHWQRFDSFVAATRARGMRPLITLTPTPRGTARAFGRLAVDAGRRYRNSVDLWALVNEPNSPQHLLPQWRGGQPASPIAYRRLVSAGLRGLAAAGHPAGRVLLGELLGTGADVGGPRSPVRPLAFTRRYFCLDRRDHPRRCINPPRRLRVAGWSFHPYPLRGGPLAPPRSPDDVSVTRLGALRRTLDAAWRAGRTATRLPLWDTEGGVQTDPPDRLFGVPPPRQARFLNEIEWMLWRTPTVRSVAQYLWRDERNLEAFQTGLRFADGRPKPSLRAWRLPIHVRCRGPARLEVWLRLPPGERARSGGGRRPGSEAR